MSISPRQFRYHVSDAKLVPAIEKEGLKAGFGDDRVFMSRTPREAAAWSSELRTIRKPQAIFRVDVEGLDTYHQDNSYGEFPPEHIHHGDIPPERVKKIYEGHLPFVLWNDRRGK